MAWRPFSVYQSLPMIYLSLLANIMLENVYFQFEADFVASLRCIPMQVRYNLDTCGVKLKLSHWHQFSADERHTLVNLPCTTPADIAAYRTHLQTLVVQHTHALASELPIDPNPAWLDSHQIPAALQAKLQEVEASLSLLQWQGLTPLQRFALIKLSRASHENRNFIPALQEFLGKP